MPDWKPCSPTQHAWKPVEGWSGRYRCAACFVIGYRKLVAPKGGATFGLIPEPIPNAHQMIEYKCKKCCGPTTKRAGPCPNCKAKKANGKNHPKDNPTGTDHPQGSAGETIE